MYGNGIGHRNYRAIATIASSAAILVITAWLLSLVVTGALGRINGTRNPVPTVEVSGGQAELHILDGLLGHLKDQHRRALRSGRNSNNPQTRAQQMEMARDIKAFMREVVETMNTRTEAGYDENEN